MEPTDTFARRTTGRSAHGCTRAAAALLLCLVGPVPLLGATGSAVRVTHTTPPNRYFATARDDVQVDGDLREWQWDTGVVHINTRTAHMDPPPVASDDDLSAKAQFAWDGGRVLYVAAIVRDQSLVALPDAKTMPWKCDSLIVSLNTIGATRASDRYRPVLNVKICKEPFFGFSYYTSKTGPRQWTKHTRYACRKTSGGYTVEAAVALADIGYDPRVGDKIKAAFILADHDARGKFAQLLLGHPSHLASSSAAVNFWLDLRFRDRTPYAGELVAVQHAVTPGGDIVFQGQIDTFGRGLRLKAFRLKDARGKTVATVSANTAMPAGRRTMFSGTFAKPAVQPGRYEIAAVVGQAGTERNGSVHGTIRIVASDEAGTTSGKLPERYVTFDPYRYKFPSDPRKYKPQAIAKADYIKLIKRVYDFEYPWLFRKGQEVKAGVWGTNYAMAPLALYKHTGDVKHLQTVLALVRSTYDAHTGPIKHGLPWVSSYRLVNLLLADPNVPERDKVWLRDFYPRLVKWLYGELKPREWGAMNRALAWGAMLEIGAKIMPDHPDAKKWKTYADLEWTSWWPFRDHTENSSGYNAGSLMWYLDWAEFRNPAHLKDPGVAKWIEREMLQVTPCGGQPGYGDATPWNGSCWPRIALFERMATLTRDGRFKWAAHRLLEYANRQMDDLFSYHMVYDTAAQSCAWAYLFADDSVAEVVPDMRSRVTTRKRIVRADKAFKKRMLDQHGIPHVFFYLSHQAQPDKLILRAGPDPFAPCGMIELCSNADHHVSTVPNFNNFMHHRAVLLTDLGYFEKGPEYHNVIFIEDLTGIALDAADEVVSEPVMENGSRGTYASVKIENYKNWPVTNDRRVLFTHAGPTVVKDLVTFHVPFATRVRQQWQTRNIFPKAGANWANVNIPHLLNTGLGLGHAAQRWVNPNWDLLIYFTPQPGRDYEVFDRTKENVWQAVPLRISQRYRGLPVKDHPVHFTTLLWPHEPDLDVDKYVKNITVLADTPETTVLRVALSKKKTLYLGIHDTGERRAFGDVVTDARLFLAECDTSGKAPRPTSLFALDATVFALGGKDYHKAEKRTRVDKRF